MPRSYAFLSAAADFGADDLALPRFRPYRPLYSVLPVFSPSPYFTSFCVLCYADLVLYADSLLGSLSFRGGSSALGYLVSSLLRGLKSHVLITTSKLGGTFPAFSNAFSSLFLPSFFSFRFSASAVSVPRRPSTDQVHMVHNGATNEKAHHF